MQGKWIVEIGLSSGETARDEVPFTVDFTDPASVAEFVFDMDTCTRSGQLAIRLLDKMPGHLELHSNVLRVFPEFSGP